MLQKIAHFLRYHNAIPLILGVVFLGSGAAFAASPEVRGAVFSSATTVYSVDNSHLISVDLASFNPHLTITTVAEDDSFFYVGYRYRTIAIDDYVWKEIERTENLAVSKAALGEADLGVFVARELGQVIDHSIAYLTEAQRIEEGKGATNRVETTEYSGLIGKLLDPKETVFEGYQPVKEEIKVADSEILTPSSATSLELTSVGAITNGQSESQAAPPAPPSRDEIRQIVAEAVREILANGAATQSAAAAEAAVVAESQTPVDTVPPTITMLGNNPAAVDVGAAYSDLGVTVTDNVNDNLGYSVSVDGREMPEVSIDTSAPGEHTITYTATDQAQNSAIAIRTVFVVGPVLEITAPQGVPEPASASSTPDSP